MRISSTLAFDRASRMMGSLSQTADRLNTQIATGKKLTAPSTDAAAYRQLTGIRREAADSTRDSTNITLAQSLLTASDTALSAIEERLQRAQELTLQGANGTLSPDQKAANATELDEILKDVVRLANATDPRGAPLFSGSTEATPYTIASDLTVTYNGSGESAAIPIGGDASVQALTSGERAFAVQTAAGPSDIFAVLKSVSEALRTGGDVTSGIADVKASLGTIADARASIGARGARLELEGQRLEDVAVEREDARASIEDADPATTIMELQKTLTVLQATQASFSKLSSLSLFDYIR